jgi:HEAT repeat protein
LSDSSEIEALVAEAEGADSPAALELLRRATDPAKVLSRLSKSKNVDVRGWVVVAAQELLGARALPLLSMLLDDPDPDIRVMAMSSMEEVDATAIARLARRLRRRIQSSNPYEALATSWTLAQLRDRASVPLLEEYRDAFESWQWQYKAAEAVLLYMTDPDEVVRRVRDHDHDRMTWLSYAASLIGSPEAIAALRECSTGAPDPECRGKCSYVLEHDVVHLGDTSSP